MLADFLHSLQPRRRYMLILVVATLLAGYTSYKIWMMCQIRGWVPGATTRLEQVTQKHISNGRRGDAYWVSWTDQPIQNPGDHRLNLTREQWQAVDLGDTIEVVYASGSSMPHTRDGIYAENGSFIFDGLLLIAEITTIIVMIVRLFRLRRNPPPDQPASPDLLDRPGF
jgi:hypothetical protein